MIGCAIAYPVALLAVALAFSRIGEHWWVTAIGLYAPRAAFAAPLPFIVFGLLVFGLRRWLWTQLVAALLVLLPLMGFVPPSLGSSRREGPVLRVLTFNVNSAYGGVPAVAGRIFEQSPDLVLLQEAPWAPDLANALRAHYEYVETSTQFVVASRYRIESRTDPERLGFLNRARSPRFIRYQIQTPLGSIAVYNLHPISPRGVLHVRQFRAALHDLRTGRLFAGDPEADVRSNFGLRSLQIESAARAADRESLPVVLAGDTNLPGLSAVLGENLSGYRDGFSSASWGFGYTYPEKHPFLRLDRILVSDKLRFASFRVACPGVSDHLCVVAEIQASP